MNPRLFSVQDIVAGVFHPPMCFATEGVCLRALKQAMSRPEHTYAQSPADYVVYEVGEFDEVSGTVIQVVPRRVCSLSQLVQLEA